MNYYRLQHPDGTFRVVSGENTMEIIRKYDLCTRENDCIRIIQLEGEQLAIAVANDNE